MAAPFSSLPKIIQALREDRQYRMMGDTGAFRAMVLAKAVEDPLRTEPLVVVTPDEGRARALIEDIAFFTGWRRSPNGAISTDEEEVVLIPEIDTSPYADTAGDPRSIALRLAALERLLGGKTRLIVLSLRSLLRKVIAPEALIGLSASWRCGEEVEREDLLQKLVAAGYERVDVVEDPGTFAVRGGVVDVFVPSDSFPTRIEWFGDEIEGLRIFDPSTQRSLRKIEELSLHPVRETVASTQEGFREGLFALADKLEVPSSTTRQTLEHLENKIEFFGVEALVPLFHEEMVPVWQYWQSESGSEFSGGQYFISEEERVLEWLWQFELEADEQFNQVKQSKRLACPPGEFFVSAAAIDDKIKTAAVVGRSLEILEHRDEGEVSDNRNLLSLAVGGNEALRKQLEASRSNKGAEVLEPLMTELRRVLSEGEHGRAWEVVLAAPNLTHAQRLSGVLRSQGLAIEDIFESRRGRPFVLESPVEQGRESTRIRVTAGSPGEGFYSNEDRVLLLSESDIYGRRSRRRNQKRRVQKATTLSQLQTGDYVVHVLHGVGQYTGLSQLAVGGVLADFVLVQYAGNDKLYLPVHRIGEIERYVSAESKAPKLDKLGGHSFAIKTKKVQADVRQMAEELLKIYAQRESMSGYQHPESAELCEDFEATFPFEETVDQAQAIDAVNGDLSHGRPMDRLVCGDVGFGKTEVALRAAFRVAVGGRQVAVLAPTTVLVQQHFLSFRERLSSFGLKVGCLNRFQSAKSRKEVLAGVKDGSIDVVVGTHRLLSRDVHFKDLSLLIVDEEQRFGVAQKERFKKLKTQIDILALSATPIPRTLQMSFLGMREISMITTPPVDRLAIRTFITREGDRVIEDGIRKELARGGQVFYVVPRVLGIDQHATRIRELVPDARVAVGHGQMPAELLEKTMLDFVEHRTDVLVSTTIVESGLDIPRANTMFIARADQFGLAQLYQLRGRIGRSKRQAYCHLMVNSLERLPEDAKRRLEAIQRHSQLGSGFNVASHDLEIRGAGELLGKRQSGSMQAIGFEAYMRVLEDAVAEIQGKEVVRTSDPEMVFDLPAFLPDTFIDDTGRRLDFYRRFAASKDAEEVRELMAELNDCYGELPLEAKHYGLLMACQCYGRQLHASAIEIKGENLTIRFADQTPLSPDAVLRIQDQSEGRIRLAGPDRIVVQLNERKGEDGSRTLEECEAALAKLMSHVDKKKSLTKS